MAIANITNNILTDSGVATSALQIALNGTGFVKISGTTISYDNSTYALDSAVVKLTGTQTVGGAKTFSTYSKFDGGVILKNNVSASLAGYVGLSAYSASGNKGINIDFDTYSASFYFSGILPYQYTFPAATGTLALTSDLSSYLPLTGGTLTGPLGGTSASFSGDVSSLGIFSGRTTNGQAFGCGNGIDSDLGIYVQTGNILFTNTGTSTGFSFAIGGTTRLSIASTGAATFSSRVNINGATDNASYALNISGDATFSGTRAAPAYIYALRNGDDSKLILKAGSTAGYFSQIDVSGWNGTGTPAYISLNAGSGTGIYINNGNNVLIGTTDDGGKVVSYTTNAATQFKAAGTAPAITFSNTVLSPTIGGVLGVCTAASQFFTGTASSDMVLANQFSAGDLIFGTNNLARMRVKASGVINITSIPTSSSGLVSGDIYSSAGVLMIV